jgi:hypothetical protein
MATFYPGVQFGYTCRWEPHRGFTPREALGLAAQQPDDNSKIGALAQRFLFVSSNGRSRYDAILATRMSQRSKKPDEPMHK